MLKQYSEAGQAFSPPTATAEVKLLPRFMVKPIKHLARQQSETVILQRQVNPDPQTKPSILLGKRPKPARPLPQQQQQQQSDAESGPEQATPPKKQFANQVWSVPEKQKFTKLVLAQGAFVCEKLRKHFRSKTES